MQPTRMQRLKRIKGVSSPTFVIPSVCCARKYRNESVPHSHDCHALVVFRATGPIIRNRKMSIYRRTYD